LISNKYSQLGAVTGRIIFISWLIDGCRRRFKIKSATVDSKWFILLDTIRIGSFVLIREYNRHVDRPTPNFPDVIVELNFHDHFYVNFNHHALLTIEVLSKWRESMSSIQSKKENTKCSNNTSKKTIIINITRVDHCHHLLDW
jgi:hypothetical protein